MTIDPKNFHNINIVSQTVLPTPLQIRNGYPLSDLAGETVLAGRQTIRNILDGRDKRIFVVVGPCSIHDPLAAIEYAKRLRLLAEEVKETMFLVMRVYFEKPRTTVGWKGFINDPYLNDSFEIEAGLSQARKLLLEIAEIGLPTGTEALDPVVPQYIQDLISWTAIGARTAESQTHRELSSGLSTPVGFKNATSGSVSAAVNALHSVSSPHRFLGINSHGQSCVFHTKGNRYAHVVLRGGKKPNYDSVSVTESVELLQKEGLPVNLMIDCSHANSSKDHNRQPLVFRDCINQILSGQNAICGLMLESNLHAGNQSFSGNADELQYGVSITDACIDWETTEKILREADKRLRDR
ncbi:MAG: 3-deoxy-7-phosphoheptulonate synthase [bacterium]|nr:3-deoxy-7-phosphoheptulonate synthase [bacterium]